VKIKKFVELNQVTKRYDNLTAVDKLSFSVDEGDIFGFLGPNGSGKSTTIRMMLSLVRPTSGVISMFGYDIRTHRQQVLSNIGALIERPDFYDYLPAKKNLEIFGTLSHTPNLNYRIDETLELVGLKDRAKSKVKTYSQGMKQRLGIAQALLHQPKMIILDEPANGLDPQGLKEMRELIKTINKDKKITILLSSHILSEIEEMANRMVIINKGASVAEGRVNDLLNENKMHVTFETGAIAKAIAHLQQTKWKNHLINHNSNTLTMNLQKEEIPEVTGLLIQKQIPVFAIKPVRSLENYFLKITRNA
jgi:ABC-type multidrug transport system ATPase subunit